MKNIIFDINGKLPGGFPVRGETFKFIQDSWMEVVAALGGDVPANTPVIMSGMTTSVASGVTTLTPGWFYYNGNVYYCAGGSMTTPVTPEFIGIVLNTTIVTDDFKNLTTAVDVYKTVSCSIVSTSVTSSTQLNYNNFGTWHQYLAARGAGGWSDIAVSSSVATGALCSGTLSWRKNLFTQQLQVLGTLTITNAQNLVLANYYSQVITLPVSVKGVAAFAAYLRYHNGTMVYDSNDSQQMKHINGEIYSSAGSAFINIGFMRPDAGLTSYTVYINANAPLA